MALNYPLDQPTSIGIEQIELRVSNATSISSSPFTYKQQVIAHGGQQWEASVTIPSVRKDAANAWKVLLIGLKGQIGTFYLGDPDCKEPQGTATVASATGIAGSDTVNLTLNGSLLAGDYIQLGSTSDGTAKLHILLEDINSSGTVNVWPNLRDNYVNSSVTLFDTKGVFRLKENITSWTINNISAYGISFEAVEAITG